MSKKNIILSFFVCFIFILSGCSKNNNFVSNNSNSIEPNKKIKVLTTTTMLKDLLKNIGGEELEVESLMGEGVDPHLYKATASDIQKIKNSDLIVYHGLHLEGKLSQILSELDKKNIIEAGRGVDKEKLIKIESEVVDPHIWFDVEIWQDVGKYVSKEISKFYPHKKEIIFNNMEKYNVELIELDNYVKKQTSLIPKSQRVLVTAHDAFNYFARKYDFDVLAIQGISTESEATTNDINNLSEEIVSKNIKAIFVESSVSEKTIKSLQESVKAKGKDIKIGGELYSDSLGDSKKNTDTYIKTFKYNVDTIVDGLK